MRHLPNAPRSLACIAAGIFLFAMIPALAHEGHRDDMTDAEMAQMEADEAHHGEAMLDDHMDGDRDAHDVLAVDHHEDAEAMHYDADGDAHMMVDARSATHALDAAIVENRVHSAGDFLGRLHPIAAHFPIALLLAAAVAEIILMFKPGLGMGTVVRFLVSGGAIGAVVAAILGWFAAGWRLADRSETLGLHRWNGTAIAAVSLVAAWFAARSGSRVGLRVTLAGLVLALVLQGYLGGEMVFGPNHLGLG